MAAAESIKLAAATHLDNDIDFMKGSLFWSL
jgi:hypothetical protein